MQLDIVYGWNMSLDVDGFTNMIEGGDVLIKISTDHKLLKLASQMPWNEMLELILPDLQRTEKSIGGWEGRYECEFISEFIFYNRCLI